MQTITLKGDDVNPTTTEFFAYEMGEFYRGVSGFFYARHKYTGVVQLFRTTYPGKIVRYGYIEANITLTVGTLRDEITSRLEGIPLDRLTTLICLYFNYITKEDINNDLEGSLTQENVIIRKKLILGIMEDILSEDEYRALVSEFERIDEEIITELSEDIILLRGWIDIEEVGKRDNFEYDADDWEIIPNQNYMIAMEQLRGYPICLYVVDEDRLPNSSLD
jgi:hypothetical protein